MEQEHTHFYRRMSDIVAYRLVCLFLSRIVNGYLVLFRGIVFFLPLPLRPTNLRSLNLATWFFITAVQFLNSAQKFSSFPARTVTTVPSFTSPKATTLKATGNVLFDLQCGGNTVHTKCGLPVLTSSPGCSDMKSPKVLSARMSEVILV